MPKRKRNATIDGPIERVTVNGDASADEEGLHRTALQPRPNPPSKLQKSNEKSGKNRFSGGSRKAQNGQSVKKHLATPAISLPPEIWRLIGLTITRPRTLQSLVRVSRAFRNIFTPILYMRRIINLEYFSELQEELPLPPYLEYLQDFRINIYEFTPIGKAYNLEWTNKYAAYITKLVEATSCLRSFNWRDESCDDGHGLCHVLQNYDVLRVLRTAKYLKHICIYFGIMYTGEPEDSVKHCYLPLNGIHNLVSLELYDFYRDHNVMVKELASFLRNSPSLEKLGLGFACERTLDSYEAVILKAEGHDITFLERLCDLYDSTCKTGPLAIKNLRLGCGIYLSESSDPTQSCYLAKLVNLRSLQVLHIHNGLVCYDFEDEPFSQDIDWTLLPPEDCKSLRQISVTRLENDVVNWLNQPNNCIREIIVMDHYDILEEDLDRFYKLPSRISMIWTQEMHHYASGYYDPAEWMDIESSSDEWSDVDSWTSDVPNPEDLSSKTSDLNVNQLDAVTSVVPLIDRRKVTVLDRLPDGGDNLERLCISLDFEMQFLHFSWNLKKLQRLKQLRINAKSARGGDYPTLGSSLWADADKITSSLELAYRFAHLISVLCPSLCFIMIGNELACEVIRPNLDRVGVRTRSQSLIRLRNLSIDEVLEIELFAMMSFAEHGGLPTQRRNREEKMGIDERKAIDTAIAAHGVDDIPIGYFY